MFDRENKICSTCLSDLPYTYTKPIFPVGEKRNGRSKGYFYSVLAPFFYVKSVRSGILALKFYGRKKTCEFFGGYMADAVQNCPFYSDIEVVLPVPASKKRTNLRGYNQSQLLAQETVKIIDKPLLNNVLIRQTDSASQSLAKNKTQRVKNVKNAFKVINNEYIVDKTILLVDDVVTTGATLNECSRVLIENGAKKILCITAARANK